MQEMELCHVYLKNGNIITIRDDVSEVTSETFEFFKALFDRLKEDFASDDKIDGYFQYDRTLIPLSEISAVVLSVDIKNTPLAAPKRHVNINDYIEKGCLVKRPVCNISLKI